MKSFHIGLFALFLSTPFLAAALAPPRVLFSDVPYGSWYSADLLEATASGIVSGYVDANGLPLGLFGPENPVTIAESLKITLRGAGYDTSAGVGYGHWGAKYMSVAIGLGFQITNVPNLHLDRPATRAEVAAMIVDAFGVNTLPVAGAFDDVNEQTPYAASVEALKRDNVITGDTDSAGNPTGVFRPSSFIKRAEMVAMIMRARKKYGTGGRSSSSLSSSHSSGVCKVPDCGPAPQMPNWQCPDGSIAGPFCERLSDNRCGWLIRQCSASSVSSSSSRSSSRSSSSSSSRAAQTYVLAYTDNGFQPSFIALRVGDTVKFRNDSSRNMWVASNAHPSHGDYPEFDQDKSVAKNGQFTFTFNKIGTWGFHNHEYSGHQGVVTVDQ